MVLETVTVAQLLGLDVVLGEIELRVEDVAEKLGECVAVTVEVLDADDVTLPLLLIERVCNAVDVEDIVLRAVTDTERVKPGDRLVDVV